jgi:Ni,Fe-hydrogenase III small subunit
MVSDRYGLYLFEQPKEIEFAGVTGPITNYDFAKFLKTYQLADPAASNFFVAIYTSESPFSGKAFQGNDVSKSWHKDYGKGQLIK